MLIKFFAKNKKPHSIAKKLIMPCAIKISKIMNGEKSADTFKSIPISNNTISRRIDDISENIKEQLISQLNSSPKYSLQLDESTDVENYPQLIAYVRYIYETSVFEEMLFCIKLESTTTGKDVFEATNKFFEKYNISWSKCVAVSTDGAPAMRGTGKGFIANVSKIAPLIYELLYPQI